MSVDDERGAQGGPDARPPAVARRMQALLIQTADEPVVEATGPGVLDELRERVAALGPRLAHLEELASVRPVTADELSGALQTLPGQVARLTGLDGLEPRLDDLAGLRAEVGAVQDALHALDERVGALAVPTADDVAAAVAPRVADTLVEALAPRVADTLVEALAPRVAEAAAARVVAGVHDVVREVVAESAAESEGRVLAHVDEAVLALAEALLRRRRAVVPGAAPAPAAPSAPAPAPVPVPVPAPVSAGEAEGEVLQATTAADVEPGASDASVHEDADAAGDAPTETLSLLRGDPQDGGDEGDDGGRRPWWRPGG